MDNFMDKLSKRFNAGEIIHANGEAEARETERLRQQLAQYDQILQEVRRLNLKTAEMSEQVSQMLASGIEQFESYAQKEMWSSEVKELLAKQATDLEETKTLLARLQGSISDEVENKLTGVALRIDNSESAVIKEVTDASYRVEASISQLGDEVTVVRQTTESRLRDLQQSIADSAAQSAGTDAMEQLLAQGFEKSEKTIEESAKQIKEMIVNLRLYQDEVRKTIEDSVHKEDVKVYRNVQANLSEQLTNRFRDTADRFDALEKEVKKSKGNKALLILTFLLAGVSVVLQVVSMLGIL